MEPAEREASQAAEVIAEHEEAADASEEVPESSFDKVFPKEQLQNGWNTAWGFMVAGLQQAKESTVQGINYVSSSETMGKVWSKVEEISNSEEVKSLREKSAEATANIRAASEPILAKVVEGITKTGAVIHDKTTESMQKLEPQLNQVGESVKAGLSTVSRSVQAGFEELRTAASAPTSPTFPDSEPMNV